MQRKGANKNETSNLRMCKVYTRILSGSCVCTCITITTGCFFPNVGCYCGVSGTYKGLKGATKANHGLMFICMWSTTHIA